MRTALPKTSRVLILSHGINPHLGKVVQAFLGAVENSLLSLTEGISS
jgi:hypothetical protein